MAPPAEFTPTRGTALQTKLSELRSLMAGHTDRKEEAWVLTLFREASPGEFNQLLTGLTHAELHELASDMDNRIIGPDSKAAFLNLFSKDRVNELSVESKAKFIQALQHGPHRRGRGEGDRPGAAGHPGRAAHRAQERARSGRRLPRSPAARLPRPRLEGAPRLGAGPLQEGESAEG